MERRKVLQLAAGAAALTLAPRSASALDYPTRPVHIVVGFPPGLSPDIIARLIAQAVSERLGQQFIVDNRPGAASNIGTEVVAHATPDGYTLLLHRLGQCHQRHALSASEFRFRPRSHAGRLHRPHAVRHRGQSAISGEIGARADRLCQGQSRQDQCRVGRRRHRAACGLRVVQDDDRHRHGAGAVQGQLHDRSARRPSSDRVRADRANHRGRPRRQADRRSGVTTPTRSAAAPDIPAIAEFVPGYAAAGWYGICATAGTPDDIVEKLNAAISAGVTDPGMKTKLLEPGR